MRDRQTCIGCGKKSPETETNYTLISAQFGWRLTRYRNADGSVVIEWRCPTCWKDLKRTKGGEGSPSSAAYPESDSGPISLKPSDTQRVVENAVRTPLPATPRSPPDAAPPRKRREGS